MTLLHTIHQDGSFKTEEYAGPLEYCAPPFSDLKRRLAAANPVHEDCDIEHVSVWWRGKAAHMFVDERGQFKDTRINARATRIYYNATVEREHRSPALLYDDLAQSPTELTVVQAIELGKIVHGDYNIVGAALLWEGDLS